MRAPAGLHKKSTMLAMSAALTVECRLVVSRKRRLNSSCDTPCASALAAMTRSMRSPSTMPGRMQLTRTLSGPASTALREAVPAGGGGQVDDRAAARALYERHRLSRAIEHAVQVDGDAALPVLWADILDLGGGAGDAGVIHQHVQSAELALDIGEQALDVRQICHICARASDRLGQLCERPLVNIAHVDARAMVKEGLRDGAADARRAGRHEDAHFLGGEIHGRG